MIIEYPNTSQARQIRCFESESFAPMRPSVMGGLNPDHMILDVKIKPSSGKFKIEEQGDFLLIYTKSPPENGRANQEIIKELSKRFDKKIKIISGHKSSRKKIMIT